MRALLLAGLLIVPGTAWAGCANYIDGSLTTPAPRVMICFDGKCEETTQDFVCSNVHYTVFGYANGWWVDYPPDEEPVIATIVDADGKRLPVLSGPEIGSRLTCRALDQMDGCF